MWCKSLGTRGIQYMIVTVAEGCRFRTTYLVEPFGVGRVVWVAALHAVDVQCPPPRFPALGLVEDFICRIMRPQVTCAAGLSSSSSFRECIGVGERLDLVKEASINLDAA